MYFRTDATSDLHKQLTALMDEMQVCKAKIWDWVTGLGATSYRVYPFNLVDQPYAFRFPDGLKPEGFRFVPKDGWVLDLRTRRGRALETERTQLRTMGYKLLHDLLQYEPIIRERGRIRDTSPGFCDKKTFFLVQYVHDYTGPIHPDLIEITASEYKFLMDLKPTEVTAQ